MVIAYSDEVSLTSNNEEWFGETVLEFPRFASFFGRSWLLKRVTLLGI